MLFAAYAVTLGVDAGGGGRYGGDEPHLLIAARSLADGLDLDLADDYAGDAGASDGRVYAGRLVEPHGIGFPLLLAPAHALGGATLATLLPAAIAAVAFVLGAALARRVVPEPWATWAALLTGLSPPAVAGATALLPGLTAGALLAGAVLCALAARERPLMRFAYGGAALLALLPWLDPWLLVPAAPVALLLARWTARRGRGLVALGTVEVQLASLVFYVSLNEGLYGGLTPLAVARAPATGAATAADYLERVPRLAQLLLDPGYGVLLWAPVTLLALLGVLLLWRSRRARLARLAAERRDAEHAAFLALAVCAAQLVVAAFTARTLAGPPFPAAALVAALPCAVPLVAWGLRRAPLAGWALGAAGIALTVWLAVGGDWAA